MRQRPLSRHLLRGLYPESQFQLVKRDACASLRSTTWLNAKPSPRSRIAECGQPSEGSLYFHARSVRRVEASPPGRPYKQPQSLSLSLSGDLDPHRTGASLLAPSIALSTRVPRHAVGDSGSEQRSMRKPWSRCQAPACNPSHVHPPRRLSVSMRRSSHRRDAHFFGVTLFGRSARRGHGGWYQTSLSRNDVEIAHHRDRISSADSARSAPLAAHPLQLEANLVPGAIALGNRCRRSARHSHPSL